jgi:Fe-S cluster assembly protein SufD
MKAATLPDVATVVGATVAGRGWLDEAALRQRAGEHLHTGLTRESWKYTPIKGFLEALAQAPGDGTVSLSGIDQPGIRAVPLASLDEDAQVRVRRLVNERLDAPRHPVADLALLRARDGWLIEVTGPVAAPVEIHHRGGGSAPLFVTLAPGSRLTLIEPVAPGALLSQVLLAEVGAGARLEHFRSALQPDLGHYDLLHVRLERDAGYRLNQNLLGGARRRMEVHVVLDEPGAEVELDGAYLVDRGQHLDQQLLVEHRAGHGTSRQKFHGVGAGKGKSVFNGRIHIHPDAPQSNAELSNRNLALSPDAEMNTKPELEIYTDDVRCAHGATVGQLSADMLFYLVSRGVPENAARRLLSHGFVRECMAGPLADAAAAHFMEALP